MVAITEFINNYYMIFPFETVTKIIEFENRKIVSTFETPMSNYNNFINRYITTGYTGTCFHLAWNAFNILKLNNWNVRFVELLSAEHGPHYILEVKKGYYKPLYVDIAFFMKPINRALPMFENWIYDDIKWEVYEDKAILKLNGSSFFWNYDYLPKDVFIEKWKESYHISCRWLHKPILSKWIDKYTQILIVENQYRIFEKFRLIESATLSSDHDLNIILLDMFSVDPDIYKNALRISKQLNTSI